MAKLSPTMPAGDLNGMAGVDRELADAEPGSVWAVVMLVDCKSVTTDRDSSAVVATARVRRVEMVSATDRSAFDRIMRDATEMRTGLAVLPFDVEDGDQ